MRKKRRTCIARGCEEEAAIGGYCEEHYQDHTREEARRNAAVSALHTGLVAGQLLENQPLREEFFKLQDWWHDACRSVQTKRDVRNVPYDEAEYALEWCIRLAQEIIDADAVIKAGKTTDYQLDHTRQWVWDRFRNLEAGLRSNGLPREKKGQ